MKQSDLTPEVAEFAKRLKVTYAGGWHGDTEAHRTFNITLDDKDEVIAFQYVDTLRKDYGSNWGKGKLTYNIAGEDKKVFTDLNEFLTVLKERHSIKLV
jgi:hypothetical protein